MTNLEFRVNYVDADVDYVTTPVDYIDVDLTNDYLIWTDSLDDLLTHEPTESEINEASTVIDPDNAVTVEKCMLMDNSHNVGGSYYTHEVIGMGENKRYVFCFSFDGATATEPQLEAWDDENHSTYNKHVLGNGTPANSMIKAVCTTDSLPGDGWTGTAIAGSASARVLKLNNNNGALDVPATGETNDLYANLKIVIPAGYATPEAVNFTLCVRYAWN